MRIAARRVLPLLLTAGLFFFVLRRIPYQRLLAAMAYTKLWWGLR